MSRDRATGEPPLAVGQSVMLPSIPTRATELVNLIETRIDAEGLPPGTHLGTKNHLKKSSGMARATVNEAVRILCDRGFVEVRPGPGGGLFVATSSPTVRLGRLFLSAGEHATHIGEVIVVRDHLEPAILKDATLHRTSTDIRELTEHLKQLELNKNSAGAFMDAVWALHERIAQISPNVFLRTSYLGLMQHIREGVIHVERTADSDGGYIERRIAAHRSLVDAIISHDEGRVPEAIRVHRISETSP